MDIIQWFYSLPKWLRYILIAGIALVLCVLLVINLSQQPLGPRCDAIETLIRTTRAMRLHPLPLKSKLSPNKTLPDRTPRDADGVLRWLVQAYGPGAKRVVSKPLWFLAAQAFAQCQNQQRDFQFNAADWLTDSRRACGRALYRPNPQAQRRILAKKIGLFPTWVAQP